MTAQLRLVQARDRPEAEQLVLRPVARFAEVEYERPLRMVRACRRFPAARRLSPPLRLVRACAPGATPARAPLLEYVARVRFSLPVLGQASKPRSGRVGRRPKSIGVVPLTDGERRDHESLLKELRELGISTQRPQTRGECEDYTGPCPWVSCQFNLYLDVNPETGAIKINFPGMDPDEIEETCALRVAEWATETGLEHSNENLSRETVGRLVNVIGERIRQIEHGAQEDYRRGARRHRIVDR